MTIYYFCSCHLCFSYQGISDLLRDCLGFSLAFDIGNVQGKNYFDLHVRLAADCDLRKVHLVAMPMFMQRASDNIFGMPVTLLDVI